MANWLRDKFLDAGIPPPLVSIERPPSPLHFFVARSIFNRHRPGVDVEVSMCELPPELQLKVLKSVEEAEAKIVDRLSTRYTWLGVGTSAALAIATLAGAYTFNAFLETKKDELTKLVIKNETILTNSQEEEKKMRDKFRDFVDQMEKLRKSINQDLEQNENITVKQKSQATKLADITIELANFLATTAKGDKLTLADVPKIDALKVAASRVGKFVFIQYNTASGSKELSPNNKEILSGLQREISRAGYIVPTPEFKSYVSKGIRKIYWWNKLDDDDSVEITKISNQYLRIKQQADVSAQSEYGFSTQHQPGEFSLQIFFD